MRKILLTCVLLILGVSSIIAQGEVRIGNMRFTPEQNVRPARRTRGVSALNLGEPVGGKLNVLVQLSSKSTAEQRMALREKGIELLGFVDGNTYYAAVPAGSRPSDFVGTGLSSLVPIKDQWRLGTWLQGDQDLYPEWADRGEDVVIQLYWFSNATEQDVRAGLSELGAKEVELYPSLRAALALIRKDKLSLLSQQPWLRFADLRMPQQQLLNDQARVLSGASWLQAPTSYSGGAGLTGKGVRVGIWDGNVQLHPDYGKRVTRMEYESSVLASGGHGMHVTGSVLGSGLLIPRAQGMAFKAKSFNWNFNISSNGLREFQEMDSTHLHQHISLTQNSYGFLLSQGCQYYSYLSYFSMGANNIDQLACDHPTLTHVFAAGNNQGHCGYVYGSMTGRAKNVIYVGAVTAEGEISSFSSFGPMDDGRLSPTICAKGVNVFSTMPEASYSLMSGTSMACPVTTGHLALLTERYGQLFSGQLPSNTLLKALVANTADDMGRPGPDYQYGYGVLNAVQALTALNNSWYKEDELKGTANARNEHSIEIPEGVKSLRVMIVWADPVPATERAYGESVLVNDLDLSVACGNSILLPYVLDPQNPMNNAKAGYDHLNNIEQVVIDNPPAGECKAYVSGKVNQGDAQKYVLCWFFDYGKSALYYPMGGEVFEPGESIMVRTQNMRGRLQYEVLDPAYKPTSVSKSVNLSGESPMHVEEIEIPEDMPAGQYLLRVSDTQSHLVESKPFTIVPTPKNLLLKGDECDFSTWQLSWDAVSNATQYRVLRANLDTEEYELIATVPAPTDPKVKPSASLDGKVNVGERNLFSVQAEVSGLWSNRSIAVMGNTYSYKPVTLSHLPLYEGFDTIPIQSALLQTGDSLTAALQDTPPNISRKVGSHVWHVFSSTEAKDWSDPFSDPTRLATMRICNLDLTAIPANTKLVFSIYSLLVAKVAEDTQYRLLVNGQVVPDMLGNLVDIGTLKQVERTWDFTEYAGQKISLEMQVALRNPESHFYLIYYRLNEPITQTDVMINRLNGVSSGPNLGAVTASVNVVNNGYNPVPNVPIVASVNNQVQTSVNAKDLKPYESRTIEFPLDLTVSTPEGDILDVNIEANVNGDVDLSDNRIHRRIMNFGNVVPCARTEFYATSFGSFPLDPNAIEYVKGQTLFADMGGVIAGYEPGQLSTMQFRPSTPGRILQVRFLKWDLGEGTNLQLFSQDIPYNAETKKFEHDDNTPYTYILEGESSTPVGPILSNAKDGSLTFYFVSNPGEEQDNYGYLAEIREVYPTNMLTLAPLQVNVNGEEEKMMSTIQITNNVAIPLTDVKVTYGLDGQTQYSQVIPLLRPNSSTEVTLTEQISVPRPTKGTFRVHVLGDDPVQTDNEREVDVYNDDPGFFKPGDFSESQCLGIKSLEVPGKWKPTPKSFADHLIYNTSAGPMFSMYQDEPVTMTVHTTEVEDDMLPASVYVWFDADSPTLFSTTKPAPLFQKIPLETGKDAYDVNFDLSRIPNFKEGACRMRIALLKDSELPAFMHDEMATCGYAIDILVETKTGHSSEVKNMAITGLALLNANDQMLANGPNLPNDARAKIKLKNLGNREVSEVKVKILLDGAEVDTETVNQTIPPYGAEVETTLSTPIDLSNPGWHKVRVELADIPDDIDEYDNYTSKSIFSTYPQSTDHLYAVSVAPTRKITFGKKPSFIQGLSETDFTIETWFKLDPKWREAAGQRLVAPIFLSEGVLIAASYGASDIPANSIMVVIGANFNAVYASKKDLVSDDTWTHIAVEYERKPLGKGFYHEPHLYINGEPVELHTDSKQNHWTTADLTYPELGVYSYHGQFKSFRIWEGMRTSTQLKETMAKSVAADEPAELRTEFMMNEGTEEFFTGYHGVVGHFEHDIYDFDYSADQIWVDMSDRVIGQVAVKDQPVPTTMDEHDNYLVTAPHSLTDKKKVPFILQGAWPTEANYTVSKKPFKAGDLVDFSNAEQEVNFTVEYTHLFGDVHLSKSGIAKLSIDKSSEAELKALKAEHSMNATLSSTESKTVTSPNIEFQLNGLRDHQDQLKQVKLTVADVSDDATVIYGSQKAMKDQQLTVDFTHPVVFTVLSANGRFSNAYTVSLSKASSTQTITENSAVDGRFEFSLKPLTKFEELFTPANADYEYLIADPSIVIRKDGKFYAQKVGTTAVQVRLAATATTDELLSPIRNVEVLPAPVTITPVMEDIKAGVEYPDPVQLSFKIAGALRNETIENFQLPKYQLLDAMDNPVNRELPAAEGTYKLVPETTSLQAGNYTVAWATKEFKVLPNPDLHSLTLNVADENGAVVENADVRVDGYLFMTPASGQLTISLAPKTYAVSVSKDGYRAVKQDVDLQADLTQDIVLQSKSISLTYIAEANGTIMGDASQKLVPGEDPTSVRAVPDLGYTFKSWEDGLAEAVRTEKNVTASQEHKAMFDSLKLTANYIAWSGATIKADEAEQTVLYGHAPAKVTLKINPGFAFLGWSDGLMSLTRQDPPITKNLEVIAYTYPFYTIPLTEDFEQATDIPLHWSVWKHEFSARRFEIMDKQRFARRAHGKAVGFIGTNTQAPVKTSLTTPWISLKDMKEDITISYDLFIKQGDSPDVDFYLTYRTNENEDFEILTSQKGAELNFAHQTATLPIAKVSGKDKIQFEWLTTLLHADVAFDNIKITSTHSDQFNTFYAAGPNGMLRSDFTANTLTDRIVQVVHDGELSEGVTAVPNDGYRFEMWSDSVTDPTRVDDHPVNVTAHFALDMPRMIQATYLAVGGGMIEGLAIQSLPVGADAEPVTAKPLDGFHFLRWSDGNTDPTRVDSGMTESKSVVAYFSKKQHVILYQAQEDGEIIGNTEQYLDADESGSAVYAQPMKGYHFARWSDGRTDNPRIDKRVEASTIITAEFEAGSYTLLLTVLDEDGKPLKGVSVSLVSTNSTSEAKTDAKGQVSLAMNAPGSYSYTLTRDGYQPLNGEMTLSDEHTVAALLLKRNATVSEASSNLLASMKVMPNPFSDELHLKGVESLYEVEIIAMDGRILLRAMHDGSPSLHLETSLLPEGTYLLRGIDLEGKSRVITIVKQR